MNDYASEEALRRARSQRCIYDHVTIYQDYTS